MTVPGNVMHRAPPRSRSCPRARTGGQALVILVLMVSVAAMLLVYGATTELGRAVSAEQRTRATLDYARQALIGRAIGDANRPGSLPCPDLNDDGSAELFVGSACPTYLGRLPWRTLGVGDLRDASGERLWYALSPPFRDHPAAPALNSDSRGTLAVYSGSEATAITLEAVALVFAPGPATGSQLRDEASAQCGTTARHIPRSRCATNYLDGAARFSNAAQAGPYIALSAADAFNDRLAVIITADFMPLVEQRIAIEARNALIAYRESSACKCFPWASSRADGASEPGVNRGGLPTAAAPQPWKAGTLPPYFRANRWARMLHYAVGRSALESAGSGCETCVDPDLSVDSVSGFDVVLITPGPAETQRRRQADYIDDAQNRDGDDSYVTPLSEAASHDRLYAISATR